MKTHDLSVYAIALSLTLSSTLAAPYCFGETSAPYPTNLQTTIQPINLSTTLQYAIKNDPQWAATLHGHQADKEQLHVASSGLKPTGAGL